MLVLDTDHIVEFNRGSPEGDNLKRKLQTVQDDIAATIVSAEEQLRGWQPRLPAT